MRSSGTCGADVSYVAEGGVSGESREERSPSEAQAGPESASDVRGAEQAGRQARVPPTVLVVENGVYRSGALLKL